MDRTSEFFEAFKSSQLLPGDVRVKNGKYSLLLLKKPMTSKGDWTSFTEELKKLVKNITRMKNLLLENRKDYINLYSRLISEASFMTDEERDQIEYDMQVFMKNCYGLLKNYREELNLKTKGYKNSTENQIKDHFTIVLLLIEAHLKHVCDVHVEQNAIRIRRTNERKRLSRLTKSFGSKTSGTLSASLTNGSETLSRQHQYEDDSTSRHADERDSHHQSPRVKELNETQLTAQEMQMFDRENSQLYEELSSTTDEVRTIGGKVMEIAQLQEIFTEKVLQQENELDHLNSTVIASTEYIRDGNDQLREAIRKGTGFCVWALLFIITLSLTILFLDWYNS